MCFKHLSSTLYPTASVCVNGADSIRPLGISLPESPNSHDPERRSRHTHKLFGGSKVKCHSWGISLFFSFWKFVRPTTVIYAYKEPRSAVDYISEFCSWLFSIYRTCYRTCRTYFPHNCRPPGFIYFYEDLFAARRFYIYGVSFVPLNLNRAVPFMKFS